MISLSFLQEKKLMNPTVDDESTSFLVVVKNGLSRKNEEEEKL